MNSIRSIETLSLTGNKKIDYDLMLLLGTCLDTIDGNELSYDRKEAASHVFLYNEVRKELLSMERRSYLSMSHEDICQSFFEYIIKSRNSYLSRDTINASMRSYLITLSIWFLRNLIRDNKIRFEVIEDEPYVYPIDPLGIPSIDFLFVKNEQDHKLFQGLSTYDRYLIYLRFAHNYSISQIARDLSITRFTARAQLDNIIHRIRGNLCKREIKLNS